MINIEDKILDFEKANKNCVIAYGGDGTLLDVARKNEFKKAVFPIRNYGLCKEHKNIFDEIIGNKNSCRDFKQTIHPLVKFEYDGLEDCAAAEITLKNSDNTACMRFDLLVNGRKYMENVICDGVIFATSLGSHGYFKSITRTIFVGDNIGIGFIAPTYGINNLILSTTDNIAIRFVRETYFDITADKKRYKNIYAADGNVINVFRESKNNLSLFGYDVFCCPACRRNRNSTIINDQYIG